MKELAGKQVVITGGSSGIGLAVVQQFLAIGANVAILDIKPSTIQEENPGIRFYATDVTSSESIARAIEKIKAIKPPEILVNCAGVAHIGSLHSTSEADFDRLYTINVKGTYLAMKAVIPSMLEAKKGVIINMASIAATVGLPDRFAYSMSKGAILSMTLSVARDYVKMGIRCNSISPARVHTPFVDGFLQTNYPGREQEMFDKLAASQPIGRMGTPDEIASLVLYLCSDAAGFITGTDYPIDGGFIRLNT